MLYSKAHDSILRIASGDATRQDWSAELNQVIEGLRQELLKLTPKAGRHVRDELCAQIEHEALAATDPKQRHILAIALKGLEALDLGRG